MATTTIQTSFAGPIERSKEVLERASKLYNPDHIVMAVSGGTDSLVAADVMARYGAEFGFEPDTVVHINTGASIPQTELTARIIADMHDLELIKQGYRKQRDSLAHRILANGWPGGYPGSPRNGGHGLEWANRKDKPMNKVYVDIDGFQMWISGTRKLESKQRSANLPDSGLEEDKPRRVWVSIIGGWTDAEKRRYIKERGLPVSESYLFLGFSGECTACSFDNVGMLTDIDLLCPELGHALRSLAVWLYQRARRGDVDIDPKQLCWGWEPDEDGFNTTEPSTAQDMVGCDGESCSSEIDESWITDLPDEQIVTRADVTDWWETGSLPQRFPV